MKSPRYYRTDTAQRQPDLSASTHSRRSPGYGHSFMQASKSPAQLKTDALQMKENPLQLAQEEDELQMKQNPLQMAQEEEELQMKQNPLQMAGMEEEELQMKVNTAQMAGMEEDELQMKEAPAQKKESQAAIQAPSGSGNKLPRSVQAGMESAFSTDFSDVNIHQGEQASQVGALAYTQGDDIHFAPGQYDPQSQRGQELLGHELTHVVQQRQGRVQPTTQARGIPVNDDHSLETEADNMGKRAVSLQRKEDGHSSFK